MQDYKHQHNSIRAPQYQHARERINGATVHSHGRARFSDLHVKLISDTRTRYVCMAAPPMCRSAQSDVCVVNFNLARPPRPTLPQT